jgi:ribosomal protein S12 methylthiotransferase accessory factor
VLDGWSGVELLEGHLGSALAHSLKGGDVPPEMITQVDAALDTLDAAWELEELRRRGLLEPEESAEPGVPRLVAVADYLDPQLEDFNRDALRSGSPWMLVRPRGAIVWIGPVFAPGRGACWACLAARLRAVREAWNLPERREDDAPVTQIALDLAALEAARWRRQPDTPARLLTFDTRTLQQQEHIVVPRPDCAACGHPSPRHDFRPLILESREKVFTLDGGHRTALPEQTFERYEHLVSPLTGIVHDVRRAEGDPGTLHTFHARHNFRINVRKPPSLSMGKGMTSAQARTGALCEALERYCGVFRGDEPLERAAFRDLDDAVHPHACLGFSERQYDTREEWNRYAPSVLWTPERFREDAETGWAPAWSLTHQRKRHVAAQFCYYRCPAGNHRFASADSNGNAAGTSVEDAVLQGLLELIERDASGIWWYGRIRRPAVLIDTPYVRTMTRTYAAEGWQLRLLDLTTDLGIPVCAAVATGEEPGAFMVGYGAHLDPAMAASRAITEANQTLSSGRPRQTVYASSVGAPASGARPGADAPTHFLEPDGVRETTTVAMPSDDLRDDVAAIVAVLARSGLEVIALDQTREDVGLPVVKVIVPGLRHVRPRFASGRLYDVPHGLGWVERPMREEELNPLHPLL